MGQHDSLTREQAIEKLGGIIKGIRIAMLTTNDNGLLRSRPMATQQAPFDGDLWFFCDADSAKVYEIRHDRAVNVSYADADHQTYASVSGQASVVRDSAKARELWTPFHKAWFPKGPDDPSLALLSVRVEQAEYWDAPSSTMTHIVGFAKAVLTGHRYVPGENEKLDLNQPSSGVHA